MALWLAEQLEHLKSGTMLAVVMAASLAVRLAAWKAAHSAVPLASLWDAPKVAKLASLRAAWMESRKAALMVDLMAGHLEYRWVVKMGTQKVDLLDDSRAECWADLSADKWAE